ncbi:hypothetical protein [Nocardia sp. NPDC050793]|uniref:hypothetical protein n=1 Tax=Nocardia sp. NPDC050793 TaxID=3155159 RepID=UPI0033E32B79
MPPALLAVVVVGIVVLLGGIAGTVLLLSFGSITRSGDPLVLPEIGQCTEASGIVLEGPIEVVDCTRPTATTKVVVSEIVTGTGNDVDCGAAQVRIVTTGYHDGDFVVAHSCGAPNLTIGNCYTKTGSTFVYDPSCYSGSVRLERQIPGADDVEECVTAAPDDYAGRIRQGSPYNFADKANGFVTCFLPAD